MDDEFRFVRQHRMIDWNKVERLPAAETYYGSADTELAAARLKLSLGDAMYGVMGADAAPDDALNAFKMAQLTTQYLVHCQNVLAKRQHAAKKNVEHGVERIKKKHAAFVAKRKKKAAIKNEIEKVNDQIEQYDAMLRTLRPEMAQVVKREKSGEVRLKFAEKRQKKGGNGAELRLEKEEILRVEVDGKDVPEALEEDWRAFSVWQKRMIEWKKKAKLAKSTEQRLELVEAQLRLLEKENAERDARRRETASIAVQVSYGRERNVQESATAMSPVKHEAARETMNNVSLDSLQSFGSDLSAGSQLRTRVSSSSDLEQKISDLEQRKSDLEQMKPDLEQMKPDLEQMHLEQMKPDLEQRKTDLEQRKTDLEQRKTDLEQEEEDSLYEGKEPPEYHGMTASRMGDARFTYGGYLEESVRTKRKNTSVDGKEDEGDEDNDNQSEDSLDEVMEIGEVTAHGLDSRSPQLEDTFDTFNDLTEKDLPEAQMTASQQSLEDSESQLDKEDSESQLDMEVVLERQQVMEGSERQQDMEDSESQQDMEDSQSQQEDSFSKKDHETDKHVPKGEYLQTGVRSTGKEAREIEKIRDLTTSGYGETLGVDDREIEDMLDLPGNNSRDIDKNSVFPENSILKGKSERIGKSGGKDSELQVEGDHSPNPSGVHSLIEHDNSDLDDTNVDEVEADSENSSVEFAQTTYDLHGESRSVDFQDNHDNVVEDSQSAQDESDFEAVEDNRDNNNAQTSASSLSSKAKPRQRKAKWSMNSKTSSRQDELDEEDESEDFKEQGDEDQEELGSGDEKEELSDDRSKETDSLHQESDEHDSSVEIEMNDEEDETNSRLDSTPNQRFERTNSGSIEGDGDSELDEAKSVGEQGDGVVSTPHWDMGAFMEMYSEAAMAALKTPNEFEKDSGFESPFPKSNDALGATASSAGRSSAGKSSYELSQLPLSPTTTLGASSMLETVEHSGSLEMSVSASGSHDGRGLFKGRMEEDEDLEDEEETEKSFHSKGEKSANSVLSESSELLVRKTSPRSDNSDKSGIAQRFPRSSPRSENSEIFSPKNSEFSDDMEVYVRKYSPRSDLSDDLVQKYSHRSRESDQLVKSDGSESENSEIQVRKFSPRSDMSLDQVSATDTRGEALDTLVRKYSPRSEDTDDLVRKFSPRSDDSDQVHIRRRSLGSPDSAETENSALAQGETFGKTLMSDESIVDVSASLDRNRTNVLSQSFADSEGGVLYLSDEETDREQDLRKGARSQMLSKDSLTGEGSEFNGTLRSAFTIRGELDETNDDLPDDLDFDDSSLLEESNDRGKGDAEDSGDDNEESIGGNELELSYADEDWFIGLPRGMSTEEILVVSIGSIQITKDLEMQRPAGPRTQLKIMTRVLRNGPEVESPPHPASSFSKGSFLRLDHTISFLFSQGRELRDAFTSTSSDEWFIRFVIVRCEAGERDGDEKRMALGELKLGTLTQDESDVAKSEVEIMQRTTRVALLSVTIKGHRLLPSLAQ